MLRIAFFSLLLAVMTRSATADQGPLFSAPSYNVGVPARPAKPVLADLNHDGVDDVVVSLGVGGFAVALATGGGSLGPFTRVFTSHVATGLFVLDVDGDGELDAAVGGDNRVGASGTILVAYGDGTGAWVDSTVVAVSPGHGFLGAAGDLDGDGRGDLVFALTDSDSVVVLRGNADRTLTRVGEASVFDSPNSIEIGDLTGSAALDLLIGYTDSTGYSVVPNLGGGVLGARTDFASAASFLFRLATLDANPGLDLIAIGSGLSSWTGLGGGAFGLIGALDQGAFVAGFELCDLDHDGTLDVLGAKGSVSPRTISTWKGLGGGAFGPRIDSGGSQFVVGSPVVGDIDGDGNIDVIYSPFASPNLLYSLGNGDGTFGSPPSPPEISGTMRGGAPADFDGDGKVDMVASLNNSFAFAKGHGDGTFDPFVVSPSVGNQYSELLAGFFDGDANLDMVGIVAFGSTLSFFHGLGNGTFSAPVNFVIGAGSKRPTLVDLDGNGLVDVVVPCTTANSLSILMQGPAGLGAPTTAPMQPGPVAVRYRDLNADGALDRVSACAGQLVVELADGLGGYGSPSSTTLPPTLLDLALADLDEDGFPDALVAEDSGGETNPVHVLKGHPGGTFDQHTVVEMRFWSSFTGAAPGKLRRIEAFDADGDGHVDVVIKDGSICNALAARGNGDRTFGRSEAYSTMWNGTPTANTFGIADFNGDGHLDVLAGGGRGGSASPSSIAVLVNRTGRTLAVPPPGPRRDATAFAIRSLIPNPAHGAIALTIESAAAAKARVTLFGANGRLARSGAEFALAKGANRVPFDTSGLAPGLYWVRVTSGASAVTRRVVVVGG